VTPETMRPEAVDVIQAPEQNRKRIAIIAVHGVADQQPGDSVRQIANILSDFGGDDYRTPVSTTIRVPLEPVHPPEGPEPRTRLSESNKALRNSSRDRARVEDPSLVFMKEQLRYYSAGERERTFETTRLETGITSRCDVHLYEAYWADLSRLSNGLLAFFMEAYQLLLHLPSLGRTAVDYAAATNGWNKRWKVFSFAQTGAVRWLTLGIATWALSLASFILPAFLATIEHTDAAGASVTRVAVTVAAAVAALILAGALLQLPREVSWTSWVIAPLIAAGAAAYAMWEWSARWSPMKIAALILWFLGAIVILVALRAYNERRPGALVVGGIALATAFFSLLIRLVYSGSIAEGTVQAFQIVEWVVRWLWRVHLPWAVVTALIGLICAATSAPQWRRQAFQTAWTARTTIFLPTLLFANLNLAIWSAFLLGFSKALPNQEHLHPLTLWTSFEPAPLSDPNPTFDNYANWVLSRSASTAFIGITLTLAVFCVVAVWSIFPSVIAEMRPRRDQHSDDRRMVALGSWLRMGLRAIPLVATTVFSVAVVVILVRGAKEIIHEPHADGASHQAVVAAGALMVFLISARFWLPGAAGALDVMLDVDNYMREHPRSSTPRARIAERYASLLQFIVKARYDRVIIIAHSQGTVITADLFRYLKKTKHPLTEQLEGRVVLFTMGCPLRQLYAEAFPALYDWVIAPPTHPDPEELSMTGWVNAYRSGDYVGRWLWRGENDQDVWRRRSDDPQNSSGPTPWRDDRKEEFCIGEGAHTHYWDWSGVDVGVRLGALVRDACAPERA